jgi:hypothetical protein
MDALTAFGLFAVCAMLVCYALEDGFLQGAWPFGTVEAVWSVVALRRWWMRKDAVRHGAGSPQ